MKKSRFADLVNIEDLVETDLLNVIKAEFELDPSLKRSLIIRYLFSNDKQRDNYLINYHVAFLYFGKRWKTERIAAELGLHQPNVSRRISEMRKRFDKLKKNKDDISPPTS